MRTTDEVDEVYSEDLELYIIFVFWGVKPLFKQKYVPVQGVAHVI